MGRRTPSPVARRVTAPHCSYETRLTFSPHTPDHLAHLTASVVLRAELARTVLRFSYATDEARTLSPELDVTILSDEFYNGQLRVLRFTGTMFGLRVQDLEGAGVHADFAYATYQESDT